MTNKKFNFDTPHLSDQMKASAQQIWLAGLGAFAKNQEEGKKVFEKLVEDGLSLQKKTQETLHEKVHAATDTITEMASSLSKQVPTQWSPLEDIFQNRVAKANAKLGVPSHADFEALLKRIVTLESLLNVKATPQTSSTSTKSKSAAKSPAKTTAKSSAKSTQK
jgi:poly(hydroxyalkanoate) granule-associated protein